MPGHKRGPIVYVVCNYRIIVRTKNLNFAGIAGDRTKLKFDVRQPLPYYYDGRDVTRTDPSHSIEADLKRLVRKITKLKMTKLLISTVNDS
jgi:predicted methyltransferase